MTMVIFTVVFGNFAEILSDGLPYPIFAYAALLPWNLFANALHSGTNSVVGSAHLISKVYFSRLIVPLSATLMGLVDFVIAFLVLVGMMVWFGIVRYIVPFLVQFWMFASPVVYSVSVVPEKWRLRAFAGRCWAKGARTSV